MDPNAALEWIRSYCKDILEGYNNLSEDEKKTIHYDVVGFIEEFKSLDDWNDKDELHEAISNLRLKCIDVLEVIENSEDHDNDIDYEVIELINTFEGLDNWIGKGGFLPKDWER